MPVNAAGPMFPLQMGPIELAAASARLDRISFRNWGIAIAVGGSRHLVSILSDGYYWV